MKRFVACVFALLICSEVFAQFGGGIGRGSPGGTRGAPRQAPSGDRGDNAFPLRPNPAEQLTQQLDALRDDLKLTMIQEKAWIAYADRVMAIADDVSRDRNRAATGMKVMQRLNQSVDSARNRATALEEVSDAAKKLYEQLTPDQQVTADPRLATLVQEAMLEASLPARPPGVGRPPPRN